MAPTLPQFNPARWRSYILRLPLLTRLIILFIWLFWILSLRSTWGITRWGALVPKEVNLTTSECTPVTDCLTRNRYTYPRGQINSISADVASLSVYRLNTYPLVHRNFLHAAFNVIALMPLLERFETEHGTLLTGAMFAGRMYL